MMQTDNDKTFVDLFDARVAGRPESCALSLLRNGETVSERLTYSELRCRSLEFAERLQEELEPRDRVLLLLPNGVEYAITFLGCLYAGVVAVPAYPTDSRQAASRSRLQSILRNAKPKLILTTNGRAEAVPNGLFDDSGEGTRVLEVDSMGFVRRSGSLRDEAERESPPSNERRARRVAEQRSPDFGPASVAFLQYTSGSTSDPKGVMVTQGNLVANTRAIRTAFAYSEHDRMMSWLPLFHDMGLVGGLLAPLSAGAEVVLMTPEQFVRKPGRWLRAISNLGCTISGGPDFAYRLCLERLKDRELEEIDLSTWRVAFNGAEPVRATTLSSFSDRFAQCGFEGSALLPCYGLAEFTLMVSGAHYRPDLTVQTFDAEALGKGLVRRQEGGQRVVSCGSVQAGEQVCVVDPATRVPVDAHVVGEICVAGPSLTAGYHENRRATEETFIELRGRRFLRTGDMGFVRDGEIFVTGRQKDMLVVRGQNIYPQDVEELLEGHFAQVRRAAVFSARDGESEGIGVAVEVRGARGSAPAICRSIRELTSRECGEPAAEVYLVRPGVLPLTTSGKIQRRRCSSELGDGTIQSLGGYGQGAYWGAALTEKGDAEDHVPDEGSLAERVARVWKEVLGVDCVLLNDTFLGLGGSSLTALQALNRIAEEWGVDLSPALFIGGRTLGEVASTLRALERHPASRLGSREIASCVLSPGEEGLWTAEQLSRGSPNEVLVGSFHLLGNVEIPALEQAFRRVIEDQENLRTNFVAEEDGPRRKVHDAIDFRLEVIVGGGKPLSEHMEEMRLPFDLARDQLLRARLIATDENDSDLVLAMHHIITDAWSMDVLERQVLEAYGSIRSGERSPKPRPGRVMSGAEFAAEERAWEESKACQKQCRYWENKLASSSGRLPLPGAETLLEADRVRADEQLFFELEQPTFERFRRFASENDTTTVAVLLAVFQLTLARTSGTHEVRVGVPFANRSSRATEDLIGFLVNTCVMRLRASPRKSFQHHVEDVTRDLLEAFENQRAPLRMVREAVCGESDITTEPLFEAMYNHVQSLNGVSHRRGGLEVERGPRLFQPANVPLVLDTEERAEKIRCVLSFDPVRFSRATMERLKASFLILAEKFSARPHLPVGAQGFLDDATYERCICTWNATEAPGLSSGSLHRAFEAQVERSPQSIAARFQDAKLTFLELNRRANQWARAFRAAGVGPETGVILYLEASLDVSVAVLAALKAGAFVVFVDAEAPQKHLEFVLQDVRPRLLVTQDTLAQHIRSPTGDSTLVVWTVDAEGRETEDASVQNLDGDEHPEQLAYCIYTSGSTGRPKAVMVTHASVLNHAKWLKEMLATSSEDRVLQSSPFVFDASLCEFWLPWLNGGQCILAPRQSQRTPTMLLDLIERWDVTLLQSVPSLLELLLDEPDGARVLGGLRSLVSGGEALGSALRGRLLHGLAGVCMFNLYGPTETTVDATGYRLSDENSPSPRDTTPIGRPISNARAYVLDESYYPVPVGVVGELFVAGRGVARGYLNRPELTADRFVPDPFSPKPGGRLYRTGDRARYRDDGNIEYVERADQQVKLHGHRIELGEVAARLLEQEEVRQAVAIVREDAPRRKRLVAYVVAKEPFEPSTLGETLRGRLGTAMPAYMVPHQIVFLETMPLNQNGKLDAKALPAPTRNDPSSSEVHPKNDLESALQAVWEHVLGEEPIFVQDNFFSLGGDSIAAIQIAAQARTRGMEILPKDVFEHQTIEALAQEEQRRRESASPDELLGKPFVPIDFEAEVTPSEWAQIPVAREDVEDVFPLSPMQRGMYLHTLMEPRSGIYLMQDRYRISSEVDQRAFLSAWDGVVARHPALRASFHQLEGRTLQVVHRAPPSCTEFIDLTRLPKDEQERYVEELLEKERFEGLDFSRAPLLRLRLVRLAPKEYLYLESHHHILMDDWCRSLLLADFFELYEARKRGATKKLAPAPSYRGFISWLARRNEAEARAYWTDTLGDFDAATPLPLSRNLGAKGGSSVANAFVELSLEETRRVAETAARLRLTPNTIVQGAWALQLSHFSSAPDVVFGVTVAGRPTDVPDVESTVGIFVNTIPLRVSVPGAASDMSVSAWLSHVQSQNVAMRRFEHSPLVEIQEQSSVPAGEQLFASLLVFENAPLAPSVLESIGNMGVTLTGNRTHTNYPLTVVVLPGERLKLLFSFDEDLFERCDVERALVEFRRLILEVVDKTEQPLASVPTLASDEERKLLGEWNATERSYPFERGYVSLFEEQVSRGPERVAVSFRGQQVSYLELDRLSNRVARALRESGVEYGDAVCVLAPRSITFLVLMLGILKVGAAYVPLGLHEPRHRMASIARAVEARALVTTNDSCREASLLLELHEDTSIPVITWEELPASPLDAENSEVVPHPSQLAYVIHTSGSTGTPKGAMISMEGMLNNQLSKVPYLQLTPSDVIAQTAAPTFDISIWQFLAGLLCGARIEIVPDDVARDPVGLLKYVQEVGITVLESVPSLIAVALEGESVELPQLRWMLPTGEALSSDQARRWLRRYPDIPLVNAYGPAECSDDVALSTIRAPIDVERASTPIGCPTDNTKLFVLGSELRPVPKGAVGQLYVGGRGVGHGYVRDPRRTAEVFVPNPWGRPGERMYATGDRVTFREDGQLAFLGRSDHQVKLRGHRIELGEIETRLLEQPEVGEAVVMLVGESSADKRLVAYVAPTSSEAMGEDLTERVAARLLERLPGYMVPTQCVVLEALPKNQNGKVDRTALPAPKKPDSGLSYVAPRTGTEERLARIYSKVLGIELVSVTEDFFALGGHSLLLTQVASLIEKEFGVEVPLRDLFERRTVESVVEVLEPRLSDAPRAAELDVLAELLDEMEGLQ